MKKNNILYKFLFLTINSHALFFLFSCSSYINKIHNEIDNQIDAKSSNKSKDKFEIYRNKSKRKIDGDFSNTKDIDNFDRKKFSSRYFKNNLPSIKRNYERIRNSRYKADDLIDNSNEGSLWSGRGQDNFLFSQNNYKNSGDIIVLKVQEKLKKEISLELARSFPDEKKKYQQKDKSGEPTKQETGNLSNNENSVTNGDNKAEGKIYDKISSVVIEEISKDHLLIRGRKDVLYKSRKRLIEVQALIGRKDITDDDSILSSNILESNVVILR